MINYMLKSETKLKLWVCKVIVLLLLVLYGFGINQLEAEAAGEYSGTHQNLSWSIKNDTLTISGNGDMAEASRYPWDQHLQSYVKRVEVGSGITSIAKHAFDSSYINTVVLGPNVRTAGQEAFSKSSCIMGTFGNLTWKYADNSIIVSGSGDMPTSGYPWNNLFHGDPETKNTQYDFERIIINSGITSIGPNAFNSFSQVKNIGIGPDVKTIGDNAFNCTSVVNIFNAGITNQTIGSNAFLGMPTIEKITYAPTNANFINLVNGKANSFKTTNKNGYIEIASGTEWYSEIAANGVGWFELMRDINFSGNISIPAKFCSVIDYDKSYKLESNYQYTYGVVTYPDYKIKPLTESYREWPLYEPYYGITGKNEAELYSFYGALKGNGHVIRDVNFGLFNNNYGDITNIIIENVENQNVALSRHNSSAYTSPKHIGSIASTNYGTLDGIEITGRFAGSRTITKMANDYTSSYFIDIDGNFQSGGLVGYNYGTIRKSHVSGYMRGLSIGGICYENQGTIYGCSVENTIYGEAYSKGSENGRVPKVNQVSNIGGISVNNNGLVEQCYAAPAIISHVYGSYDVEESSDPSGSNVIHAYPSAAGLIVNNKGTVKACSTGGYINLSDATVLQYSYNTTRNRLETNYARFIRNNEGNVDQGFSSTGFRYTRNYGNPARLTYNFTTSGSGNYNAFYSLQNENFISSYNSGYEIIRNGKDYQGASHSCQITAEDSISENAKQYVGRESYDDKQDNQWYRESYYLKHDHNPGFCGTLITSAQAKGNTSSSVCGGLKKEDWTFSTGNYPRPKDSLKVHVSSVVGRYNGVATEGTQLDRSKIEFLVYYSNGTIFKCPGTSPDITYPYGTYLANVGGNNIVHFTYTDTNLTGSNWPETGYDTFTVMGKEREPVDILRVEYDGTNITENTNYNLSNIRVTVLFDNGTQATFLGSSGNVGITQTKNSLGDLDGNGVVNLSDYALLRQFLTSGTSTLTSAQRKQADVDKNGTIETADLSSLNDIISRLVPFDRKTFYVKYSGLDIYKPLTITSVKRKINGISISAPAKVRYIEGEDFETKGMVVTVKYNNGESQSLYFKEGNESFDGLSLGSLDYPVVDLIKGQDKIPITYTENSSSASAFLNIVVRQVYLTSIAITQEPNIKTYYSGESFDRKGMKITAYYDEGVYTDGRDENFSRKEEIPLEKCTITGSSKLIDSTSQILLKADEINNSNRDMKGFEKIEKRLIKSPTADSIKLGDHVTINYIKDTIETTLSGTMVGNNYITVSYTEGGVTRTAFQPIVIEKRKLTKIEAYQHPHKTKYVEGDLFDASGLVIRAYYTDGTSDFVYAKNDTNVNGFDVINGDQPLPIVSTVTIKYTDNGTSAITTIPITVTRNDIESISASYVGPKIDLGEKFSESFVLINVEYKNGTIDSFYADKLTNGNTVVDIYRRGTADKDYQLHDSGENVEIINGEYVNHYTAVYAGLNADFSVIGIRTIPRMDFSGSVAQGRRDAAEWTETFQSTKVKTVYDYINEYAQTGNEVLAAIDGKDGDGINAPTKINPLQWFEREGDWIEPLTSFVMEYKTRTSGFLFPETGTNADGSGVYDVEEVLNPNYSYQPYLNAFNQNREELRNPTQALYSDAGWSDWVRNGDSAGTANARRVAYDYTEENPDGKAKTSYIDSAKFRLNALNGFTFKDDENPQISIFINGDDTNPYIVTKNSEVEIKNIQTMKMVLGGKIRVRDNTGVEKLHEFKDVYRVGYKIGTSNEPYNWNNEWVGVDGIPAECFEVKIQLSTAPIDEFSFASKPFISTQPEDVSCILGNKAIFTVKAVGQNLSYQWYRIDAGSTTGKLINGATKYFYETPAVTLSDDKSLYYCVVTNGSGSTETDKALLSVVDRLPEITANLQDTAMEVGQEYTFTIAATCENPATLKYQWEMTNKNGEWEVIKPESPENSYSMIASEDTHNRYLRCKVSNSRGSVYSNPARLSTKINPTVKVIAPKITANINEKILLTTQTTSFAGTLEFSWYVNQTNVDEGYQLIENVDKTFEFSSAADGEYQIKCIVKDHNGYSEDPNSINLVENDKNAVTIRVGNAPRIGSITYKATKTGTAEEITGTVNKYELTFTPIVTYSDHTKNTLSYQWYLNGKAIAGETNKTLVLNGISENNQMTILCKVSDLFGTDYKSIQVTIEARATFDSGLYVNIKMKALARTEATNASTVNTNVTSIKVT